MQFILEKTRRLMYHEIKEGEKNYLIFEIPRGITVEAWDYIRKADEKSGGEYHLIIGTPKRRRTLQQNSCVWGWCGDIAEQMMDAYPGYSYDEVKERIYEAMKRLAVTEAGWPTVMNPIDGEIEPISQSQVSIEQDQALIDVIKRFADTHGLWLTERIGGEMVKTIGGVRDKEASKETTIENTIENAGEEEIY